jgi:uncharacterized protein
MIFLEVLNGLGDWHDFGRFVRLMSALTAQEINHSQLGCEIGITPKTAQRWLRMMQDTFQWFELPPFFANRIKRVSKSPKGYLLDTGMACHHAAMSSPQALGSHPLFGAQFETAVVCEIRKTLALMRGSANLYHWRASTGRRGIASSSAMAGCTPSKSNSPPNPRTNKRWVCKAFAKPILANASAMG